MLVFDYVDLAFVSFSYLLCVQCASTSSEYFVCFKEEKLNKTTKQNVDKNVRALNHGMESIIIVDIGGLLLLLPLCACI